MLFFIIGFLVRPFYKSLFFVAGCVVGYLIVSTVLAVLEGRKFYNDFPNALRIGLSVFGGWLGILGVPLLIIGLLANDEALRRVFRLKGVIVFSGIDGTGKTSHALRARRWLGSHGFTCRIVEFSQYLFLKGGKPPKADKFFTSFSFKETTEWLKKQRKPPGRTRRFSFIRPYLAWLDNIIFFLVKVLPAVWRGDYVVCDRFIWDNYVKHKVLGYKTPILKWLAMVLQPKLGFIFDVPPRVSRQRTSLRAFHYEYTPEQLQQEREEFKMIGRRLGFPILHTDRVTPQKTWNDIVRVLEVALSSAAG